MFISIDIGGTNTRIASSKNLKDIHLSERFPSQDTVAKEKVLIEKAILRAADNNEIEHIVIGVPGIIDKKNKLFVSMPNYNILNGTAFSDLIETRGRLTVKNDSALAGLGEAVYGSGKNFESVAYIAIGTGVGGSKIVNKRLDETQKISEPGHQIIKFDGDEIDNGIRGTAESFISGPAFERLYEVRPQDCQDENIWKKFSEHLSATLHNITVMWDPQIIVLGGGMANEFDLFINFLLQNMKEQSLVKVPEIQRASLGDNAGLVGGFAFIEQITQ
jgi:glucokinase